jgi:hypothetical protein
VTVVVRRARGRKEGDNVADQDKDQLDDRVEELDRPEVEAHKLESRAEASRAEASRAEASRAEASRAETDEPDVEAHRFDKFEGRAEA